MARAHIGGQKQLAVIVKTKQGKTFAQKIHQFLREQQEGKEPISVNDKVKIKLKYCTEKRRPSCLK